MKRIILDNYFLAEPSKENFIILKDELEKCVALGLLSYSDMCIIIKDRKARIRELKDE